MSSDDESFESDAEEDEEEWTNDHLKLLHLVSRYAKTALNVKEKENWIRKNSLLVLMYEGIVASVFDYDYAPQSNLVGTKRVWMNITQEGKDDIDDLREKDLLNGLKITSEDLQPITCYQVSEKGLKILELVPDELKEQVDAVLHHEEELLTVQWSLHEDMDPDEREPGFVLCTSSHGIVRDSGITETEDVSYVSSPYLPECVRGGSRPMNDNSGRSHESAAGISNIKDELSEAITLGGVCCLVGEWIPFGSNQIVSLNDKLGSADRCQGGMFTGTADKDPSSTKLSVPPGLTSVKILDFDETTFINFEAEINYPEEEGIVQVEEFGIHLHEDGTLIYGMKVEAIQDRTKEDTSLDMLSRLIVDVMQDSSQIADSLLSFYQRGLLSMCYMGDEMQREKFTVLVADTINPKLEASRYMDREENENELKQVLGDTDQAFNLSVDDLLIRGKNGILIVGPNCRMHEDILVTYLSLLSRDMFIRSFFTRVFVLQTKLEHVRTMIANHEKNPNTVVLVRSELSAAGRDIITLKELLGYLHESLKDVHVPERPTDVCGKRLHTILDCAKLIVTLDSRLRDLDGTVDGAQFDLDNLTQSTDVINSKGLEKVFKKIQKNVRMLVEASEAEERGAASLEIMEVIFNAALAWDLMYRIFGIDMSVPTTYNTGHAWHNWLMHHFIWVPGGWFVANMVAAYFIAFGLKVYMNQLAYLSSGFVQVERLMKKKCDLEALDAYLATKEIEVSNASLEDTSSLKTSVWFEDDEELWHGAPPKVELSYDTVNSFVISFSLDVDKKKIEEEIVDNVEDVQEWCANKMIQVLRDAKVLVHHKHRPKLGAALED